MKKVCFCKYCRKFIGCEIRKDLFPYQVMYCRNFDRDAYMEIGEPEEV